MQNQEKEKTVAHQSSNSDSLQNAMDFWLGEWDLTWTNASGALEYGTNHVHRILDSAVMQGNFRTADESLTGISLTVYNPNKNTWFQTWGDNQGAYYAFTGLIEKDKRIFSTEVKEINGNLIVQRIVFYDIKSDSLKWSWELSRDGGETFEPQWQIDYKRRND